MEIRKTVDNEELTVDVNGRIDTTTAPSLEETLKESYDSCNKLIIDFAQVEYISSAGLRVLLSAQKVMGKKGGLVIRNVDEAIMEIFEVTGFSDILTIE